MNITLLTIIGILKVVSLILLFTFFVVFIVDVNKNKIYTVGFNLSFIYLFFLIFDVYDSSSIIPSLIIGIPYIIGIAVFMCGILDFNGLKPLIAHIKTIWKSTNYQALKFKFFLDSLKKIELSFIDRTYFKYPRQFVGWFILIILFFRDILTDLVWIGLFFLGGLHLLNIIIFQGLLFLWLLVTIFSLLFLAHF